MRLKRLISAFITCAMLVTFMPMQAFAAPKDLNDTEFHIMQMDEIKNFVRKANDDLSSDAEVKIYGINVYGTTILGKDGKATGGITDSAKWSALGDYGSAANGRALINPKDYWTVWNDAAILNLDYPITSIEILSKINGTKNTTVAYLNEDSYKVEEIKGTLVTEIYLTNATFKPQYTVTYTDGVEDEVVFEDQTETVEEGMPTPQFNNGTDPVREGYNFTGWKPEVAQTVTADATYTAQWTEKTWTLTYDANGGEGAPAPETGLKDENKWHELSKEKPTHDPVGETPILFVGWTLDEYNRSILTKDSTNIPEFSETVCQDRDKTVYAIWAEDSNKNGEPDYQEKAITVTFDAKNGSAKQTKFTVQPFITDVSCAPEVTAPAGQMLEKWVLSTDNSKTLGDKAFFTYDSIHKIANGADQVTFEAVYKDAPASTIKVAYVVDENKGTATGELTETVTIAVDGTATLNAPEVEGKDGGYFKNLFTGWTCEGANVTSDNGIYTLKGVTAGESYTLTAEFIQDEYMIFAKASENGKIRMAHGHGTGNEAQVEYTSELTDGQIKITFSEMKAMKEWVDGKQGFVYIEAVPNDPTKYGFAGWDDIHISGPEKSSENPFYVSNLNESYKYSLTATFNPLINVTFDAGEHGTLAEGQENNQTVVSNYWDSNVVFPELVVADGYTLTGWLNSADGKTYTSAINKVPTEWNGATFTAQYKEIKNPIKKIDVTIGENLAKEMPELLECQELHPAYGSGENDWIFMTGSDGHFTTPWIADIWHPIPDSLTTAVDTVEEARVFFGGFTAMKTFPLWDTWKDWLGNDVILDIRVDGSTLYMTLDKKPTTKEITLNIYDIVNGKQVEERTMTVAVDATSVNTSDITLPADYEFTVTGDLPINDNNVYVEVRPIAQTKEVTLNIYDIVNREQVEEQTMTVSVDATSVNTSDITLPANYEFTVTGDLPINDNNVYVEVRPIAQTKEVTLNIYDIVNHEQVKEEKMTVAADAIHVNTGDIDLPEGYEFTVTGDLPINDNNVYVEVKPVEKTKDVTLNIYDIVNHKQVEEQTMAVAADAIHVNTGDINLPEGYEFTVTGDLPIRDNNVYVEVRPVETGKAIVNIRFMDGDEFVAGGDYPFEDGESVQFGDLELPEGYELDTEKNNEESGFVAKDGVQIIVHVKKAETDVIMNIRFVDEDTGEFVAGGDYFLPAGVQNYSILEEYVPDGYEMTVSGDFTVTADGKLDVPVKKIAVEPGDVTMNIRFMYGDEFVAGGDYFIPEGVQNYSILEKYVPEGYRMAVSGDFMAVNGGKLDVPLEKIDAETVPVTIQYFHGKDLVKEVHREMTEGVHSYRELEKDVPEGYAMAVAGDFYAKKDAVIVVDLMKEEVAEYKVTVNGSYANHSGEGKYAPGETVTIKAGTRDNYSFDGWESDDVDFEDADDSTTTFIMPAGDVTVTATWDRDSGGGGAHHPDAGDNDDDDDNDRDDDTEEIIDEEVPLAETPWLNTEDHYAYVVGYSEDGTVRPNSNITRAEVATIFFRLLTDNARDQFWMTSNNFSDVLPNDWYNTAVSTMVNMGIIQGYEDGTFRPNANITRAEFATIAARFLASGYEVEDDLFGDVAAHWARESINDAATAGWINGYEDGTFRPDAAITRAEAVTMVNNVLGRKPDADHMLDSMMKWTDNMDTSAWYYEAIQEATNSHDYDLFEDAEYETWTALQENRDWAALEKDWANAHVA